MFNSLFATNISFGIRETMVCLGCALLYGLILSVAYMLSGAYTKSFAGALVLFPAVIQTVILFTNQSFGAALAVGGAFALMNFRSAPGSGRDMAAVFCSLAIGVTVGMGYVLYGAALTIVLALVMLVLGLTPFGEDAGLGRQLKILIPESLDYTGMFDDIFATYTRKATLQLVRTTNMGSMFEVRYHVVLKDRNKEKEFLDALRTRNGNLPITCAIVMPRKEEL